MAQKETSTHVPIISDIRRKAFKPVYLLMGEEPYYIDLITDEIVKNALNDDERDFNQTIVYGADTDMSAILTASRRYPMMAERQLVVVKEMQMMRSIDDLLLYLQNPQPTTVLVLNYKNGLLKNKKIIAEINRQGVVYESKRIYESQLSAFVSGYVRDKYIAIDDRANNMLCEAIGTNLSRMAGEIDKLCVLLSLSGEKRITADMVELHVGISKEFNNFELTRAISDKNMARAMLIADHFRRNPKENPLTVTLSALFTHFQRIFIVNYKRWECRHKGTPMPSDTELCALMKLPSPFFLNEYKQAADRYPNKKVFAIFGLLRECDMRSKGLGNGSADEGELLRELLLKIFLL